MPTTSATPRRGSPDAEEFAFDARILPQRVKNLISMMAK